MRPSYRLSKDTNETGFHSTTPVGIIQAEEISVIKQAEAELIKAGAAAILIIGDGVNLLPDLEGYLLGPFYVKWEKSACTTIDEIDRRIDIPVKKKRKKKENWKNRLKQTEGFIVKHEPIDSVYFDAWYALYKNIFLTSKAKGVEFFSLQLINPTTMSGLFLIDPDTQQVVGGLILEQLVDSNTCKIKAIASYKKDYKCLDDRLFEEFVCFSMEHGFQTLSYGNDPNIYGDMVSVGLHARKTALGFRPTAIAGNDRLIKLVDTREFESTQITYAYSKQNRAHLIAYIFEYPETVCLDQALPKSSKSYSHSPFEREHI